MKNNPTTCTLKMGQLKPQTVFSYWVGSLWYFDQTE